MDQKKIAYWVGLVTVCAGLYFYRNWGSLPSFGWSDALGLAFVGLIVYWIVKPSVRANDTADS